MVVGIHLYTRVKNLSTASTAPSKGSSLKHIFQKSYAYWQTPSIYLICIFLIKITFYSRMLCF
ncbi:hypothetical protein J536_1304 [Acinetobacter sp. 809848]|nr:hypothetical protein J536_1304 [Acinetobacter sp. 809848]